MISECHTYIVFLYFFRIQNKSKAELQADPPPKPKPVDNLWITLNFRHCLYMYKKYIYKYLSFCFY